MKTMFMTEQLHRSYLWSLSSRIYCEQYDLLSMPMQNEP